MSLIAFDSLPSDSRLFIFNAERALADLELDTLRDNLVKFLQDWTAHRNDLTVGFDLRYNQFILIAIDESRLPPSGCSIDALMRFLKTLGDHLRIELVDSPDVCYVSESGVLCVNRAQFSALIRHGDVNADTEVFDNSISRLSDLHNGKWRVPASHSWHGKAFDLV